ncbi:MAG TPA: DUF2695 domain-containing protein [Streptosporangiaceae bacterium]|jgi:hypothetical protein
MPENIAYAKPSAASGEPAGNEPVREECLRCYLARMIRAHGCDNTMKWTLRWRDRRAPGDVQLLDNLEERGGICCDCEVVFNVWQGEEEDWPPAEEQGDRSGTAGPLPSRCAGAAGGDPLMLCARWRGWSLSDPYDPDDDDDDDFDDSDEMEW